MPMYRRDCHAAPLLYPNGGTACVAAHSTTRALFANYSGPLYRVTRASDGQKEDIDLLATGGYANAGDQKTFCAGTTGIISLIYDQTACHNDLTIEPAEGAAGADTGVAADGFPINAGGAIDPVSEVSCVLERMGAGQRKPLERFAEGVDVMDVMVSCCAIGARV
jgi:hypothetical protein